MKERYGGGRKRGERRVGEKGRQGRLGTAEERGGLEREIWYVRGFREGVKLMMQR